MNIQDLINEDELADISLTHLGTLVAEDEFRNYFLDEPGKEHYKLLAYFSQKYNDSTLLDIGTYKGCSALALSYNPTNRIKSFDIGNFRGLNDSPGNVEYLIGMATDDQYVELIKSSPFIMVDVDHTGLFERQFHIHLQEMEWKGILFLDDINLNDPMREYWAEIPEEKLDVSRYGHWSGTGVVFF